MAKKKHKKRLQANKTKVNAKTNKIGIKILGLLEGDTTRTYTLKQIFKRFGVHDKAATARNRFVQGLTRD